LACPWHPANTKAEATTVANLTGDSKLAPALGYDLWLALIALYEASGAYFLPFVVAFGSGREVPPIAIPYHDYKCVIGIGPVKVQEGGFALAPRGVARVHHRATDRPPFAYVGCRLG